MTSFRLLLFIALALTVSGQAQTPEPLAKLPSPAAPPEFAFTVECQMVTIPGKLLPTVVPELNNDAKAAAGFERLQAMIAKGEATLTGQLASRGAGGEPVQAESKHEIKYATEFEPPQLPATTPVEPSLEVLKNWPHVGIIPTAFETRNVGQMMKLEIGRTADPKVLVCSYEVQHVRLEKFVKTDAGRLANGERLSIEQPYFSSMKDQSIITTESGQPKLLGVHRLPGAEGVYELFILTVRLAPAKKP